MVVRPSARVQTRDPDEARTATSGTMTQAPTTVGWEPTCEHADGTGRSVVLDPFSGSGTTAWVARQHGRHAIGIDLSEDYLRLAAQRLQQLSLLA